jgi:hypothetical protein
MIEMKDISGKILWTKGREAGVEAERERIIDYLRDLQCDVLAYKEGYDVGTLQAVISWIEGRDND